jgi:uncharacterized protein (UPF0297 family)
MSRDTQQETMTFKVKSEDVESAREILQHVFFALREKGYNPINQLVGGFSLM